METNWPTLDITTYSSRTATKGKSEKWSWEHFAEVLEEACAKNVTKETHAEYMQLCRSDSDKAAAIKDTGGFIGGLMVGRRNDASLKHRQLLTLDIDGLNGPIEDLITNIELLYGFSACVYSTHKHSPENPYLRLVTPLSRHVNKEEYKLIGKAIADALFIQVDNASFVPAQLMFWPSHSRDVEPFFLAI